ncbi:hypothetical protein CROQUDRAFT_98151 [Cronartium quercuum f. sp. fusiforme G11]|uniref:Reverse transcriptase domain-containing protein n=1 Tax=Cronartium quercuum f. sp. fusiforme G11 TaxID=708437 RepID=A0A9P6T7T8_9BASI|nr:hypothetical protein CROQUDRAFT_98151 [Cronartium quercuum f. sp. fusiforme G11]
MTIALGDYTSPPKSLNIGLPQGSPLSIILYILYNSSLLTQATDLCNTISLGFIDDMGFATAHKNLDAAPKPFTCNPISNGWAPPLTPPSPSTSMAKS